MLQYIINVSAIWLISLVAFEVFLSRQSFHRYNRLYLLTTLLAGALLPLWHWQHYSHIVLVSLRQPIDQFINFNQSLVNTTTLYTTAASPVLFLYLSGCAVAFILLLSGIVKLTLLYSRGKKYRSRHYIIVETHSRHSPCSFLNILFVSDRKLYNTEEWDMLLLHELRHNKLLHAVDMLLLQLAQIIFWFHPLVYIFRRRLLLVHEYQADQATLQPVHIYGRFLAEQSLLQHSPSVSHALSNMPVSKRIRMLSHRSAWFSHANKLLVIPMLALFMICFTRYDIEYQFAQSPYVPYGGYRAAGSPFLHLNKSGSSTARAIGFNAKANNSNKEFFGNFTTITPAQLEDRYYHHHGSDDAVILLAGMENNPGSSCCSSGLLWGTNGERVPMTTGAPVSNVIALTTPAYNSCNMGFNPYREYSYANAMESYRHTQQSWNTPAAEPAAMVSQSTMPLIISDNPWITTTDNNVEQMLTLSIDRSLFGSGNMFDNATAMITPKARAIESAIGEPLLPAQWDSRKSSTVKERKPISIGNQQIMMYHQHN